MATVSPIVPNAPILPAEARAKYSGLLTAYEMEEINGFQDVYFLGQFTKKNRPNTTGASNYGFDNLQHHYRCNNGDHVAYRFEIRAVLGKGAFGQVLRCFDHKTQKNVALKMIINTEQMHEPGDRGFVDPKAQRSPRFRNSEHRAWP
jgi:dual specificity tyrosine-phosphorylation-regulated kinase 2/3/4